MSDEQIGRLLNEGGAERDEGTYNWAGSGYGAGTIPDPSVANPMLVGVPAKPLPPMPNVEAADEEAWSFPEWGKMASTGGWDPKASAEPDPERGLLIEVNGEWVRSDGLQPAEQETPEPKEIEVSSLEEKYRAAARMPVKVKLEDVEGAVYTTMRDHGAPIEVAEEVTAIVMGKLGA